MSGAVHPSSPCHFEQVGVTQHRVIGTIERPGSRISARQGRVDDCASWSGQDTPGPQLSSGRPIRWSMPGEILVIGGPVDQAALQDAHEPVGQLAASDLGGMGARIVVVVVIPGAR